MALLSTKRALVLVAGALLALVLFICCDRRLGLLTRDVVAREGIAAISISGTAPTSTTTVTPTGPRYGRVLNNSMQINDTYKCVPLKVKRSPIICTHPVSKDIYVSKSIVHHGTFEKDMISQFDLFLSEYGEAGFLDIGANIGQYSLTAAALGRQVVAVEPLAENYRRFIKGVQMNHFQDVIIVVNNAISNKRSYAQLVTNSYNQGGTSVDFRRAVTKAKLGEDGRRLGVSVIDTILLDDLLPYCSFTTAIMKMDIEGSEGFAFQHATKLFAAIHIPYIIMEWFNCCLKLRDIGKIQFAQQMVNFLTDEKYTPFNIHKRYMPKLDTKIWMKWPVVDVLWKKNVK